MGLGRGGFPALGGRDANEGARTAGSGMRSDQYVGGGGYGGYPGAYMLPPQPLPYAIPLPPQRQPAGATPPQSRPDLILHETGLLTGDRLSHCWRQ